MCEFRAMNLTTPWPMMQPFDLIFIRNVLIYFDTATKQGILKRMKTVLLPHGSLFLGTAETTINLDPEWVPVKPVTRPSSGLPGAVAAAARRDGEPRKPPDSGFRAGRFSGARARSILPADTTADVVRRPPTPRTQRFATTGDGVAARTPSPGVSEDRA